MKTISAGCREIRISDADGAFRVIYMAKFEAAVFIIHCFRKEDADDQSAEPGAGNETLSRAFEGDQQVAEQKFDSVRDAIEDRPAEAENMRVRSGLMIALQERIKSSGMTQAEAARRFGVTQPRISDLMRGKIDVFGIDALVNMLASAGLHVELTLAEAA
jgi:predicted XRE-type DNA-binding protein